MTGSSSVLMIGLDAAETTVIERLCDEGKLPALQSLRARGCFGHLDSVASTFAGGVWPTFYTSRGVPWHGIYHNLIWRQEHMRAESVDVAWLPERPFWDHLGAQGVRNTIADVPFHLGLPRSGRGIYLRGWGTHDLMARDAWPSGLWETLETEFGAPLMPSERWGGHTAQSLLELRDQLLRTSDQASGVGHFLLNHEPWDLFLLVLGAPHRGGHYLWDRSQIDHAGLTPHTRQVLEHALVEIYQACDAVVSRLLAEAPADARILVFAVHGMGPNPGWDDRCADILSRVQQARKELPRKGLLYTRGSQGLLRSMKYLAMKRLPSPVLDRLFSAPRLRELDWRTLRYFPLPMDHAGYVRVNLRGREPQGVVQPGQEYDNLCRELADAFLSFRDIDTGDPIVAKICRPDDLATADAPYRTRLPDLVIVWGDRSAIHSRGIKSDRYGEMSWESGRLRSGRSGNHRGSGWFVAAGPGIPSGSRADGAHVVDLVPTIVRWLGAEPVPGFQGTPIPALLPT